MTGRLRIYTAPEVEPVLPAELRSYGRIPDDVADETLAPLLQAAREAAEDHLNRALISQSWDLVFDGYPCGTIHLPKPPLVSLTSVTITDIAGATVSVPTTEFVVDTSGAVGSISLKYGKLWPSNTPERAGVVIRFACGYGVSGAAVPQSIRNAIAFGALWSYDHPGEDKDFPDAFFKLLDPARIVPV